MADRIQYRRDTVERWKQYNPILLEGEVGYELDTDQYKLGDGEHAWNDLPHRGDPCLQQTGQSTTTPMSQKAVTDELNIINANTGVDEYPVFSDQTAYKAGDVVNYMGKLYQFTSDHAAGAWAGTDVKNTTLIEENANNYGTYIDNPEFIRAYTDANGKFLWGIRVGGSVEWAKGVPTPVQNALKELADKIKDLGGDKIDEIETTLNEKIEALQDAIDVINASLKPLTDTFSYQDNEEFAHVITDADGKVLFGIKVDGSPYYPNNEMYHVIQNDEYLAAWVDASGKLLFGFKADGSTYIAKSELIDKIKEIQPFIKTFSYTDNPEFLNDVTDSEGKVLEATMPDGTKYFVKQEMLEKYDDPEERTEITTDAERKVVSYRDRHGFLHEKKGIDTSEYRLNGNKKDFVDRSEIYNEVASANKDGAVLIEDVDGVSNHNTPNLLIASEMQKTFNDGTNSFTPPNEGYEMSNPIECKAGDWFTRTGTATGMVVVTDENDKNGTRLFNADGSTLGSTFQIPADMTWVRYIRMAAEVVGAEDGSVVICKGKEAFTGEGRGDYLTVTKLRIEKRNLSKDVMYVKSEDGTKFYEL